MTIYSKKALHKMPYKHRIYIYIYIYMVVADPIISIHVPYHIYIYMVMASPIIFNVYI